MEELTECPNCSGKNFTFFINCQDYTVSKEEFKIVSCETCGLKFTNPRPNSVSIAKYYESEEYISHSDTKKGFINKIYHLIKGVAIRNKIHLIEDLNPSTKKLLDIGCGTGTFLAELKNNSWQVTGIEPNTKARVAAINNYKLNVVGEEEIKTLPKNSYSVITLWHVLEHVHKLKQRVNEIFELLDNNGFVIIAVPNHTSWDAKYFKSFWAAYDVPRHLYHFSPTTIKKLFGEKFIHIKSIPMKFDAYYVSMLSEKYKGSFLRLPKAFFLGMISNIKAKSDPEKFSSVIYIFQKKST